MSYQYIEDMDLSEIEERLQELAAQISSISSYTVLSNKPQIEGVTLSGNKTYEDLNLQKISNSEMEVGLL